MDKDRKVAFIDLGTNSARMMVVSVKDNGAYSLLSDQKVAVRLGEGGFSSNRLTPEAMDRALLVLSRFAKSAQSLGALEITALATSATRDAENAEDFIGMVKVETGLDLKVISGLEEARLIYLGVSRGHDLKGKNGLFIDIGGGSTELILGHEGDFSFLDSLQIGTIRVYNRFFQPGYMGPVDEGTFEDMKRHVLSRGIRSLKKLRSAQFDRVLASSGTARHLQELAVRSFPELAEPPTDGPTLTLQGLKKVSRMLCPLTALEREKLKGVSPRRKDIIVSGAAILEAVMEELAVDRLTVADRSLRNGMLEDYLVRNGLVEGLSVREESVLRLGRSCGFDESHGRHIAGLALSLFDSSMSVGLHDFGPTDRELLYYAGLLHDIGMFLSLKDHHIHGGYIVRHSQLLGFTDREMDVLSALVQYHRGKRPKSRDSILTSMDVAASYMVQRCSIFLRMAESMDRSHREIISRSRFERREKRLYLILTVKEPSEWDLERWALESDLEDFKKVFHISLKLEGSE